MKKILLVPALLAVFLVCCGGEEGSSYGTNPLGPGPGSGGTTKTQNIPSDGMIVDGDTVRERGIAGN